METYQLNIWDVQLLNNLPKFSAVKSDFKKNLLVNGTKYSRMDQIKCDLVEDNLIKQIISLQIFWRLSSTNLTSSIPFFVFFNCYLAAPRPILGHSQVDRLNNPMLITAF